MRRAFAVVGWIVLGLVLVMLIRAVNRPDVVSHFGNGADEQKNTDVLDVSGGPADDAGLLDRYAPDPDFIDQAKFKAIKDRPCLWRGKLGVFRASGAVL